MSGSDSGWGVRLGGVLVLGHLLTAGPTAAQVGTVVNGRVEDAQSRMPVAGALVYVSDTLPPIATDSLGRFATLIRRGQPLSVEVESYGYRTQRFDLSESAASSISVLLLEPAPIVLDGLSVVDEARVTAVLRELSRRRDALPYAVSAYDAEALDDFGRASSAWEFLEMMLPQIHSCSLGTSGVCVWDRRAASFGDLNPESSVPICVDRWMSSAAETELRGLPMGSVALVEIYGRGRRGIRVYTTRYLAGSTPASLAIIDSPLRFYC